MVLLTVISYHKVLISKLDTNFLMRFFQILLLCFFCIGNLEAQSEWQKHESPVEADLHNIFFVDNSVGWIVTHSTGAILHTKDAGENWVVQARHDSISYEDIHFLDEYTGWVSGEEGLLYKTTDGGKHWSKHQIADEKSWIYAIHFFNEEHGIATGLRTGKPRKVFLKTVDGGKTWNSIEQTPGTFYTAVNFINNKEGYVGGLKQILYTNDRGVTWQMQFPDSASSVSNNTVIRGIVFITPEQGWAVGHNGLILKTEDGENWKRHEKFTGNRLRDIAFVNQWVGYIVGDSNKEPGVLYRTDDGGQSWQTVLTDTPDLHKIALTENKIWLVGKDGTILSKER